MEPVLLDMVHSESYQYESYGTYGDSANYSCNPVQYNMNQLLYSEDYNQNAILLAADRPFESYESIPSDSIDNESNKIVMSFRTEAEMLDYFGTLGGIYDIQTLPIVNELENEKYTGETTGQNSSMETSTVQSQETAQVLPVQPAQLAKRKRPTKKSNALNPKKRAPIVYENSSFVCEPCGRTFGSRGGLIQHNNTQHSGPREHRCEECGKRFHTQDDLQRHIQRHVAQHKPHKCAQCPRQFNYPKDLERHTAVRHGVAKYECQHCGKRIARRDHLLSHEASHAKKLARERLHEASQAMKLARKLARNQRQNRFQELVQELQL